MEAILGAGKEVTSSSDEVEHKLEREQFSQKYQEMHRLVREADGSTVLYIGAENWPFPMGSDCDYTRLQPIDPSGPRRSPMHVTLESISPIRHAGHAPRRIGQPRGLGENLS